MRAGYRRTTQYEMTTRELAEKDGRYSLSFRSAAEIGEDRYYRIEADISGREYDEVRAECESSCRMWIVDLERDWTVGYAGKEPVGIVRTAIEYEATGVVDNIWVKSAKRRQGYGLELMRHGTSGLAERTDVCRLDVDESNVPARKLYEKLGFGVHHQHALLQPEHGGC